MAVKRRVFKAGDLAAALGVSAARVSQLRKESWFPVAGDDGGWDVDEVRQAIAANVNPRLARHRKDEPEKAKAKASATTTPRQRRPTPAAGLVAPALVNEDALAVLEDGAATAAQQAIAARQLAAQAYAAAARSGRLGPKEMDGFKKALEEQRRTESGFLELEKKRGRVIAREVCAALCAQLARRCVLVLDQAEATLASQVEIWLSDDELAEMGAQDRQRVIRQWFHDFARGARETGAAEIEQLINEMAGELQEAEAEGVT